MLSAHDGLPCAQVIEAVRDGMERAKEAFHVRYGIITCAMRHHSEEQNLTMLRCTREYLGMGVCALDLAGDESAFPTRCFRPLLRRPDVLVCRLPFTQVRQGMWKMSGRLMNWEPDGSGTGSRFGKIRS